MFILFVSDIHLCSNKPHIVKGFLNFLYYYAIHAKALYILGDLFDIWIGDDDPNPLHKKISHALKYLHKHHILCYFIHGNHDFLLGEKYANNCSMTLLPNQKILNFLGYRLIILHGDILCLNDTSYECFKKITRIRWIQKLFLSLPISVRLYVSHIIQHNKNRKKNVLPATVNQKKIKNILIQTNTDIMIHGHIHQANIYYKIINKKKMIERVVLSNWKNIGSVIKINKNGIHLVKFHF